MPNDARDAVNAARATLEQIDGTLIIAENTPTSAGGPLVTEMLGLILGVVRNLTNAVDALVAESE